MANSGKNIYKNQNTPTRAQEKNQILLRRF